MNYYLVLSALLIIVTGIIHSLLGEKLILKPILKSKLPALFNGEAFMKQVLRLAWHLMTIVWWGISYIFLELADNPLDKTGMLLTKTMIWVSLTSGIISLIATRGRHFVWAVFLLVTYLLWMALHQQGVM